MHKRLYQLFYRTMRNQKCIKDSTSCFTGQCEIKSLKILKSDGRFVDAAKLLGEYLELSPTVEEVLEEFTCRLCGVKEYSEVNNARYELFCKPWPDPQGLLPTQDALFLHMDRANYQCYERKSALTNENRQVPDGHGWLMKEGVLPVEWCRQKPEPDAILSFVTCTRKKNKCQTGSCGCLRHWLRLCQRVWMS